MEEGCDLRFGIIEKAALLLNGSDLLDSIATALGCYSYDPESPPDFLSLLKYIADVFSDSQNLDQIRRVMEILTSIAGYRLGVDAANAASLESVQKLNIRLLSSPNAKDVRASVEFFRKIARIVGPRFIFHTFIDQNVRNSLIQRGLAATVYQIILDFPQFHFIEQDFSAMDTELESVVGIGGKLQTLIVERLGPRKTRLPSVPEIPKIIQAPQLPPVPPNTARPYIHKRLIHQTDQISAFRMTERQQQVREFVDQPFDPTEKLNVILSDTMTSLQGQDWEKRSEAFNIMKRLLRFHSPQVGEEAFHAFITVAIEDCASQRAALSLSTLGALQEAVKIRTQDFELELARIAPALLSLFSKTAKFYQSALSEVFDSIVDFVNPKRLTSVLATSCEIKGPKVQAAAARYIKTSLGKVKGGGFLTKGSKELNELIRLLSKLMASGTKEVRDDANDAAKALSMIYGDSFLFAVQSALEQNELMAFMRACK